MDYIRHHLWTLEIEDGKLKYSLGNLSDAGWFWNGTEDDNMFLLFLYRLKHSKINPKEREEIFGFDNIDEYYRKAKASENELWELAYAVTGDNVVWNFGYGWLESLHNQLGETLTEDKQESGEITENQSIYAWIEDKKSFEKDVEEIYIDLLREYLPETIHEFFSIPWEGDLPDPYEVGYEIAWENFDEYVKYEVEGEPEPEIAELETEEQILE